MGFYVGTSGWHYEHWRGLFYPQELSKTRWLEFYATQFSTVELNNSFYRLPTEAAFANWYTSSPPGFLFAVKVSRFITHVKRLKDIAEAENNFFQRARILKEKLGPLLYQLPPDMPRDDNVLESFLSSLPSGMNHVIEFRHPSWMDETVFKIMRRHNTGFCVFDAPGLTTPVLATADFAYTRFHGSRRLYASNYSGEELKEWAERLAKLANGLKALYVYFNNDAEAFAIRNAITLRENLKGAKPDGR